MRICLIGDFSPNFDEGFKNVSRHLAEGLSSEHEVRCLNVKELYDVTPWRDLLATRPHVIHSISRPTIASLLLQFYVSALCRRPSKVLSALKCERLLSDPIQLRLFGIIARLVRLDLALVQSPACKTPFEKSNVRKVEFLPNGVDTGRFLPVASKYKRILREKYSLRVDLPTVLHVGHFRRERNLAPLVQLSRNGHQVVMAGSGYLPQNENIVSELANAGIKVFRDYLPNIEELYQLSDCYFFPVEPGNSISMPLSILEALACGLPVVSTRFTAIQNAFEGGEGIYFMNSVSQGLQLVNRAISERKSTRVLVEDLSWENIVSRLVRYYEQL